MIDSNARARDAPKEGVDQSNAPYSATRARRASSTRRRRNAAAAKTAAKATTKTAASADGDVGDDASALKRMREPREDLGAAVAP
mmetsp:Transcript_5610/g.22059  ORF Transcript_5610/g.22059 Transcript_5610/m.22059 type:complete len:85 (+) Transcript_5610:75-329(+)